jgi:hypothetical protein
VLVDAQRAVEHDGELVELGRLSGLDPAAGLFMRAIETPSVFEFTRPMYSR